MPIVAEEPIVVDENGDIEFFSTTAEAALSMEAIDVENGEYLVFDSAGVQLHPVVGGDGLVQILVLNGALAKPDELESRLQQYVERLRFPDGSFPRMRGGQLTIEPNTPLDSLVAQLSDFFGTG